MSLEAVTTAVTAAAGAAGTEVGRRIWGSLADLARRTFGRGHEDGTTTAEPVPLPLDPASPQETQALAAMLFGRMLHDEAMATEFRQWLQSARAADIAVAGDTVTVNNTVSGNAQVRTLYQGQNINVTGTR
ncbi:hypothetical protein [Streptomyces sp. NPDC049555]|uniref:hypothetical protein n=1 Tax=Streptomyces sp. NPDC049555 TaxID=3154930 RepID=UPI0034146A8B